MSRLLKLIVVLVLGFCFAAPAVAGWAVYKSASSKSKEKHTLKFDKNPAGPIQAWFILRGTTKGVFASKLPIFKIDNNPVRDLRNVKNRKVRENNWVRWEIDDGKGAPDAALVEFMNGKSVVFQYYMPDGETRETTFLLEGLREAIGELLK